MLAGLIQLHQRCPYDDDIALAEPPKIQMARLSYVGQIDTDDDELDGDDTDDLMFEDMSEFE